MNVTGNGSGFRHFVALSSRIFTGSTWTVKQSRVSVTTIKPVRLTVRQTDSEPTALPFTLIPGTLDPLAKLIPSVVGI